MENNFMKSNKHIIVPPSESNPLSSNLDVDKIDRSDRPDRSEKPEK